MGRVTGRLPAELTTFVGRSRELTELRRLLTDGRLATLTGVGGVGKTRLALRAAAVLDADYRDGVWLVELGALRDPDLLPHAIAAALPLDDQSNRPMAAVLADYLAGRELLLVLDNADEFVVACRELVDTLLRAAPGLRVLVTSRQSLATSGERILTVPPLSVPRDGLGGDLDRTDAVMLFVDRAMAVRRGFAVTERNAHAVAALCRQLDGIPLALELAAVRLRVLTLEQLTARLDRRFAVLNTGTRGGETRHHTLRTAIGWSHELCAPAERLLWCRLAVFPADFDLAAVEGVCVDDRLPAADVLDLVDGLVDKSILLSATDQEVARYRMLDTMREFGREWLREVGEYDEAERRHRDYYHRFAARFHADWFGPRQAEWTRRMHAEHANLSTVLDACLSRPDGQVAGARLAADLYYFWYACGQTRAGRYWLERALAGTVPPGRERMRVLAAYGRILILQGEAVAAQVPARECLALARELDDPFCESHALQTLGLGRTYCGEPDAGELLEEALRTAHRLGPDGPAVAYTTFARAVGLLLAGEADQAVGLLAEAQRVCRAAGDQWWLGTILTTAIVAALRRGDVTAATVHARESMAARQALHDSHGAAASLEFLAWVAAADHDAVRAARLFGASDRHWRVAGGSPFAIGQWRGDHDRYEAATRAALGEDGYLVEFRRGATLTLDRAITYALGPS
jgi:predicted ATPase